MSAEQVMKLCPFCGGDALEHGYEWPPMQGHARCHDCNAYVIADTEAEAIAAWNRRPTPSPSMEGGVSVPAGAGPIDPTQSPSPASHARGPWRACKNGECSCGQVWSTVDDYPVAIVTRGPWGDSWPALRSVDASEGMAGTSLKVEAFIERMDYGEIYPAVAAANARLIAAAPDLLAVLKKARIAIVTHSPDPTEPVEEIDAAIAKATGGVAEVEGQAERSEDAPNSPSHLEAVEAARRIVAEVDAAAARNRQSFWQDDAIKVARALLSALSEGNRGVS